MDVHSEWLTKSRTVLILKDHQIGASNYRSITCLRTTWKLLSCIIADIIRRHMATHMSEAKEGIGKTTTRGAKHPLLIERTVAMDCKTRHTILCNAWFDYKKGYNSMFHMWILECLGLYSIDRTLRAFIKSSMRLWKITHDANSTSPSIAECLKEILCLHCSSVRFSAFYGASLSWCPWLFALSLASLFFQQGIWRSARFRCWLPGAYFSHSADFSRPSLLSAGIW